MLVWLLEMSSQCMGKQGLRKYREGHKGGGGGGGVTMLIELVKKARHS
jgi:hypothetical protein